ncbi:MAG: DNA-primase RepB domain-containing protein [Acidobacteriota bacterium]
MTNIVAELEPSHAVRRWQPSSEVAEASVMLDLFHGLGVQSFSLTFTDDTGRKIAFKRNRSVESLRSELPCLMSTSYDKGLNMIVRPIAAHTLSLIQLDDLSASQLDRVRGFSFLVLETSPDNFQAWVAVNDASPETIRRVKKAAGADLNASGATRLAGSYNFKSKYAPNYPRVRLHSIAPLHAVTLGELDRAGLIAPEEHTPRAPRHAPTYRRRHRLLVWPSYARCLADAPSAKNHEGKDRSSADFNFCLISIDRGWSVEATANQLLAESDKAKSTGYNYALFTSKRAASVVSSNRR